MHAMGIDIGTTTISLVLVDEDSGALISSETIAHNSFMDDGCPSGVVQDPERICALTLECMERMTRRCGTPTCIGLTGQMHGIVYVNASGRAVSPLYTWQDGRAGIPHADGRSAVEILREAGFKVSAGYGLATHFAIQRERGLPPDAVGMTTISDYLGMRLTRAVRPILSADMAASWGCFDLLGRCFLTDRLEALGVDCALLPEVRPGWEVVGNTPECIPVICSAGDNQASFIGSVRSFPDALLINIGTGSQITMSCPDYVDCEGSVELRPCGDAGFILAGAGLCGGRAYAMLEQFFREAAGTHEPRYDEMLEQALEFVDRYGLDAAWRVRTTFSGTRSDPAERGSITGIGTDNFHPGALTAGVILGILQELLEDFSRMRELTGKAPSMLVGSGNGLRRNPLMRALASQLFGLDLLIPAHREEAAYGAALCAMAASGRVNSLEAAQRNIEYI